MDVLNGEVMLIFFASSSSLFLFPLRHGGAEGGTSRLDSDGALETLQGQRGLVQVFDAQEAGGVVSVV